MNTQVILDYLWQTLGSDSTGHDPYHALRVNANAQSLAQHDSLPYDPQVLEAAALLHDVLDHKLVTPEEVPLRAETTRQCLLNSGLKSDQCDHVFLIWDSMGFQGKGAKPNMPSYEGRLVLDADRLDALGAVGIARCFAYGGKKGRLLYDPQESVQEFTDQRSYRNHAGSSLNHFYEKLFHLKDQMQTRAGQQIAERRDAFMKDFVKRFMSEWEGTDL